MMGEKFVSKKTANKLKEIKTLCARHGKPCFCYACFLLEHIDRLTCNKRLKGEA